MSNNIGCRIDSLIKALGIKKVRFAEQIRVDQSYITHIINGKSNPSDRIINDICREFKVDEDWLRTGEGKMFLQLDDDAEFNAICEQIQLSDDNLIKNIIKAYWKMNDEQKKFLQKLINELAE